MNEQDVITLSDYERAEVEVSLGKMGPNIMVAARRALVHTPSGTCRLLPRKRRMHKGVRAGVSYMEDHRAEE